MHNRGELNVAKIDYYIKNMRLYDESLVKKLQELLDEITKYENDDSSRQPKAKMLSRLLHRFGFKQARDS